MHFLLSFPVRERGLKPRVYTQNCSVYTVVPCAGTWIETSFFCRFLIIYKVVPCAGTWIETCMYRSHPHNDGVVPCAGTWIETVSRS